jgi:hypothetical protein
MSWKLLGVRDPRVEIVVRASRGQSLSRLRREHEVSPSDRLPVVAVVSPARGDRNSRAQPPDSLLVDWAIPARTDGALRSPPESGAD